MFSLIKFVILSLSLYCVACDRQSASENDPNTPAQVDPSAGAEAGAEAGAAAGGATVAGEDVAGEDVAGEDVAGATEEPGGEMMGAPIEIPDPPEVRGVCPTFTAGPNEVSPEGTPRQVDLFLPENPQGAPVLFLWHGLGDTPSNIARAFGAQQIAERFDTLVVVPHSSGRFLASEWSFLGSPQETDAYVFDETLGCLHTQFEVDLNRVYTTGFSAGALWSTWLLMHRSHHLAAVTLFSGGAGGINPYVTPQFKTPVLSFYGGEGDVFANGIINFSEMTNALVTHLVEDEHFVILCNHNGGHTIPLNPMTYAIPFLFEHRFDQAESPYGEGLNSMWHDYCEIQ